MSSASRITPTLRVPDGLAWRSLARWFISVMEFRVCWAFSSIFSPSRVRIIPREVRSKRERPSSSSSDLIWALTAGWLVKRRSAARVRFFSSAMVIKDFSWWSSMERVRLVDVDYEAI